VKISPSSRLARGSDFTNEKPDASLGGGSKGGPPRLRNDCVFAVPQLAWAMREVVLLASVAIAACLGMAIGFVFSRSPSVAPASVIAPAPPSEPVSEAKPEPPAGPAHINEATATTSARIVYTWPAAEKAELVRRVQGLSNSDADYLCLVLGLIPTDEVFDKVNVKGRLLRYVNRFTEPSDQKDLESAFRQLARDRGPRSETVR
jgi:hypothetical protein